MNLYEYLLPRAPLEERSMFYLSLKQANDMGGMAENSFAVELPVLLAHMAKMVKNEFLTRYAYEAYAKAVRGTEREGLAELFEEHAEDEQVHAAWLMERMAALGGPMSLEDIPAPQAYTDPLDIVQDMLRIESEGMQMWSILHEMVGCDPMKVKVEEYMVQEQHHADELRVMLPSQPLALPSAADIKQAEISYQYNHNYNPYDALNHETQMLQGRVNRNKDNKSRKEIEDEYTSGKTMSGMLGGGLSAGLIGALIGSQVSPKKPGLPALLGGGAGALIGGALGHASGKHQAEQVIDRTYAKTSGVREELGYQARRLTGRMTLADKIKKTVRSITPSAKPSLSKATKAVGGALSDAASGAADKVRAGAGVAANKIRGGVASQTPKTAADTSASKGKERAATNLAARAATHKGTRGEQVGDLAGRVLGASAALAGASRKKGDATARVLGAALGQHIGGKAGRFFGKEVDAARVKKANEELINDPNALTPGTMDTVQREAAARKAELEAHAAYNQQRAQAAEQQVASLQDQIQQASAQAQQMQQQLEATNGQLQAAQGAAMNANTAATQAMSQAVNSGQEALQSRQTSMESSRALDSFKQQLREIADSPSIATPPAPVGGPGQPMPGGEGDAAASTSGAGAPESGSPAMSSAADQKVAFTARRIRDGRK